MVYETSSAEETQNVAAKVAKRLKISGGIVALSGELGAGKTTFVQGVAKSLGIKQNIVSPTFILVKQYSIPNTKKTLYHIDLYRIEKQGGIENLGLDEILLNKQNIIFVEWPEKIKEEIDNDQVVWVSLEKLDENNRKIRVTYPSPSPQPKNSKIWGK